MGEVAPTTVEEAREDGYRFRELYLTGGWGRAALAYVCTRAYDQGGRPKRGEESSGSELPMSLSAFARLGIPGLSSRDSVRRYRRAWEWAIEQGHAERIAPGAKFDLPSVEWDSVALAGQCAPETATGADDRGYDPRRIMQLYVGVSRWQWAKAAAHHAARKAGDPACDGGLAEVWDWAVTNLHAAPDDGPDAQLPTHLELVDPVEADECGDDYVRLPSGWCIRRWPDAFLGLS